MKNNKLVLIGVFSLCILCSCKNNQVIDESSISEVTVANYSSETTELLMTDADNQETQIPDYSVGMLDVSLSFDELLDYYMESYSIDPYEMESDLTDCSTYVSSDGRFIYTEDYQLFLDEATRPFTSRIDTENFQTVSMTMYYPMEYEYHIIRSLSVDGLNIGEFESDYWAEVYFSDAVDAALSRNIFLNSSSTDNGYCFAFDESRSRFYAYYYIGNYTINYSFNLNHGNVNEYNNYLERCDELGLPPCDQITDNDL